MDPATLKVTYTHFFDIYFCGEYERLTEIPSAEYKEVYLSEVTLMNKYITITVYLDNRASMNTWLAFTADIKANKDTKYRSCIGSDISYGYMTIEYYKNKKVEFTSDHMNCTLPFEACQSAFNTIDKICKMLLKP